MISSNTPKKVFCLLLLLLLPLSGFAAEGSMFSFFSPPSTDVSLMVLQAIFGTGTDSLNGKLIRPVLLVLCSGMVIFMGAIFAWNITKFVLHTAQQGEMMVGKGKELGLVVLRSVFGMGMVLPIYTGTYKGLCMAFIVVAWLITQGVGLADRGVESVVGYLTEGGTLYQLPQANEDVNTKRDMAEGVLKILAAESCMYRLRAIKDTQDKEKLELDKQLGEVGLSPVGGGIGPSSQTAIGYSLTPGKAVFGTRNKTNPDSYFGECGVVTWGLGAPGDKRSADTRTLAMQTMLVDLAPLAKRIAQMNPNQPSEIVQGVIRPEIASAIVNYANIVGPLRTAAGLGMAEKTRQQLDQMKARGWIVLGAYYPMMGMLNRETRAALAGFMPAATVGPLAGAQLTENPESAYDPFLLNTAQKTVLKDQFAYLTDQNLINGVSKFILALETSSLSVQERLKRQTDELAGQPTNGTPGIPGAPGWVNTGIGETSNFLANTAPSKLEDLRKSTGIGTPTGGEGFAGLLDESKLNATAAAIGTSSALAGPIALVSVIPMLVVFVDIVRWFKVAIDQTQSPDPLLALQNFGFKVLDRVMIVMFTIFGATFLITFGLGWVPSSNVTGGASGGSTFEMPMVLMFFAAFSSLGVGFGIYLPMIPFVVWMSAVIGWIGHSFQAIIGAPLVALRMTTAEGEGVLGGAVEGVMMLLGVLLTPFLLVVGLTGSLILIKQLMIVVNYLFSLFVYYSFVPQSSTMSWFVIGVPVLLFLYLTLTVTIVQSICTKLIGEMPGEVLRHLHTAMTGHKAAEQMGQKVEQATEKAGGGMGDVSGKKAFSAPVRTGGGKSEQKES